MKKEILQTIGAIAAFIAMIIAAIFFAIVIKLIFF